MYFYKLTVAYDGTSFFGWQFQPNKPTVEAVFKNLIQHFFGQQEFYLVASSRTDAGVHAHGQVIRLGMKLFFEPKKLQYILNSVLPVGVSVRSVESVDSTFHPQHTIAYKRYRYTLYDQRPLPEHERYGWVVGSSLCPQRLQSILNIFVGKHDFRLYARDPGEKATVRVIDAICVVRDCVDNKIVITVQGQSFLHLMVRRIVGAAVALCIQGDEQYESRIKKTLAHGVTDFNLMKNLPTAPPQGLCLEEIVYKTGNENE